MVVSAIGAGIAGASAGELIAEPGLALELGADTEDVALTEAKAAIVVGQPAWIEMSTAIRGSVLAPGAHGHDRQAAGPVRQMPQRPVREGGWRRADSHRAGRDVLGHRPVFL